MKVRAATSGDALAIEQARIHGWRLAYRHVFPAEELDALPIDAKRWRKRLDEPPAGWSTFVAENESGSVVGFASVGPSRDELGIGELYAIYVEPEAWGTGAGHALIERAEQQLRSEFAVATLWVLEENARARQFYERAGWQPDGSRKVEARLTVRAAEVRYRKTLRTSSRSKS